VERLNSRIVAGEFEATEESGVDDRELESRILGSFRHQPSIETSRVNVEVYAGEARLRGELESEAEKAAVAELVTEVPGVIAVRDETVVVRRRHDIAEHESP
jgi:osmotically-inducible protein OsmY